MNLSYNSIYFDDDFIPFTDKDRDILQNLNMSIDEILDNISDKDIFYIDVGYIKKIVDNKCYIFLVEYLDERIGHDPGDYYLDDYAKTINHYRIKEIYDITNPNQNIDNINNQYKINTEYYNNSYSDIGDCDGYHSDKLDKLFHTYEMAFHYNFMKLKQYQYYPNGYTGVYKHFEMNKLKYEYYHTNGKISGQFYINNILYNYIDGILIDKKIYYYTREDTFNYEYTESCKITDKIYLHKYLDNNNYVIKKYDINNKLREEFNYIDNYNYIYKRYDENENLVMEYLTTNTYYDTMNMKNNCIGWYKEYKNNKLYIDCNFDENHKLIGSFKKYCDEYNMECNFIKGILYSLMDGVYIEYDKDNKKVFECVFRKDNKISHTEYHNNGNIKLDIKYDDKYQYIIEYDDNKNIINEYKTRRSRIINTGYYVDEVLSENIGKDIIEQQINYGEGNLIFDDIDKTI